MQEQNGQWGVTWGATVTYTDDNTPVDPALYAFALKTSVGLTLGVTTGTMTIEDDDVPFEVNISGPAGMITEGTSTWLGLTPAGITVTATVNADYGGPPPVFTPFAVNVATRPRAIPLGVDPVEFTDLFDCGFVDSFPPTLPSSNFVVWITALNTPFTVPLAIVKDNIVENNETFYVTITAAPANVEIVTSTYLGTIADDDTATIEFNYWSSNVWTVSEPSFPWLGGLFEGPTNYSLPLISSAPIEAPITVNYTLAGPPIAIGFTIPGTPAPAAGTYDLDLGIDYFGALAGGSINWAPGATSGSITMKIMPDSLTTEGLETGTFTLATILGPPSVTFGTKRTAKLEITDNTNP